MLLLIEDPLVEVPHLALSKGISRSKLVAMNHYKFSLDIQAVKYTPKSTPRENIYISCHTTLFLYFFYSPIVFCHFIVLGVLNIVVSDLSVG